MNFLTIIMIEKNSLKLGISLITVEGFKKAMFKIL